jgi:hypothetical protein
MDTPRQQRPVVHLIGSVPLEDPETVMRTLSAALGAHLRRLPSFPRTGRPKALDPGEPQRRSRPPSSAVCPDRATRRAA